MTNLINVSYSTVLVATDARLSIIALSDQIKTTGDTPRALTDLLNQLASLETVVQRLSLASGYSPATTRDDIEAHVHSLLLDCEKTCDEYGKTFRAFIDRALDGTTRKLNGDRFGISEELEVQLLSKQLARWKVFLSSMIDAFLYVKIIVGKFHRSRLTYCNSTKSFPSVSVRERQPGETSRAPSQGEWHCKCDPKV